MIKGLFKRKVLEWRSLVWCRLVQCHDPKTHPLLLGAVSEATPMLQHGCCSQSASVPPHTLNQLVVSVCWRFPFWDPYARDPSIWGPTLGAPEFWKLPVFPRAREDSRFLRAGQEEARGRAGFPSGSMLLKGAVQLALTKKPDHFCTYINFKLP